AAANAGFSTAPPDRLVLPVIDSGPFAYEQVNAAAAERDPDSLLNGMKRMIAVRRRYPTFAATLCGPVDVDNPAVLVHRLADDNGAILAVHNLGGEPCAAVLDLDATEAAMLSEIHGNRDYGTWDSADYRVELDPYGYRWFWHPPLSEQ
ncbi:MAG TPA: hypothetical protein VKB09_06465, partial [Thermomicrobiales bacterium]|nr:hypothetical protein [Thermomicrobiales bacterium]